jgi:hypothetical protein
VRWNRAARTAGHLFHCLGPLVGLWPGKHNASSSKMTSFFFTPTHAQLRSPLDLKAENIRYLLGGFVNFLGDVLWDVQQKKLITELACKL